MIFCKILAMPRKICDYYVWFSDGGNDNLAQPAEGILPLAMCRHLKGDAEPWKGCGGSWYSSHQKAVLDLERVLTLVCQGQIPLVKE